VPVLEDHDPVEGDAALKETLTRENASWALEDVRTFGIKVASKESVEWGIQANKNPPLLKTHDRVGNRLDQVEFHPSYHHLMRLGLRDGKVACLPWEKQNRAKPGAHVARVANHYLLGAFAENGVTCPMTMTFAATPALAKAQQQQQQASDGSKNKAYLQHFIDKITTADYDPRFIPSERKTACTIGMAMTEKQGGSDVRANTTIATKMEGSSDEYTLVGHKWFCSGRVASVHIVSFIVD